MLSKQTLLDLDIFSADSQKLCLFDKLNHCKTKGGAGVLKTFCYLKDATPGSIGERQHAVQYLLERLSKITDWLTDDDVYYTTQYLDARLGQVATKEKIIKAIQFYKNVLFKSHEYYFIHNGLKQVLSIVHTFLKLETAMYTPAMPVTLKAYFEEGRRIIGLLQLSETSYTRFVENTPTPGQVFKLDETIRINNRGEVLALLKIYYQLEALLSLAQAHVSMKLNFAAITETATPSIEGLYHPLVKDCVANTIDFSERNLLVLTGPNMAGKSTFMKSIGLAFFMSYLGVGVCAKAATLPMVEEILTSINVEDNISKGYSYFYSEVANVKHIATQLDAGKKLLVIADELFKGTNVKDAFDCSKVVLDGFLNFSSSIFIFSTHLTELAMEFQDKPCILKNFHAIVKDDDIQFNYTLNDGVSALRVGLNILRREQVHTLLGLNGKTVV